MRRCTPSVLLLLLAACAAAGPAFERTGTLSPGARITVATAAGNISAYAPKRGQSPATWTLDAYGNKARSNTVIQSGPRSLEIAATAPGIDYIVRGSRGTQLDLSARSGSINVADFDGVVNARTLSGNITMLVPQYGNASAKTGNVNVIFASTSWPGTLHFSAENGDVELYVNEHARASVHLFAERGTIFTDFPLKGTASGRSERIDGAINGGAKRAIEVRVRNGSIRLLQLKPQV